MLIEWSLGIATAVIGVAVVWRAPIWIEAWAHRTAKKEELCENFLEAAEKLSNDSRPNWTFVLHSDSM